MVEYQSRRELRFNICDTLGEEREVGWRCQEMMWNLLKIRLSICKVSKQDHKHIDR